MAGYQFLHAEVYSRSVPKKANRKGKTTSKTSVRGVFAEALREPDACTHVRDPIPPDILYGDLAGLEAEIDTLAETARDARGHKLRKDATVLLAGVATYPPYADPAGYDQWEALTMDFLRAEYGDDLKAVVRHTDEPAKHLHFYATPDDLKAKRLHRGYAAAEGMADPGPARVMYKAAMRQFQDDYFDQVAAPCGMTRLGPGRQRLSRSEQCAREAEAEAAARAMAAARSMSAEAEVKAEGLRAEIAARVETARAGLAAEKAKVKAEIETARQGEKAAAAARVADLRDRQIQAGRELADRRKYGDPASSPKFKVGRYVYEPAVVIESAIRAHPGPGVYDRAEARVWHAQEAVEAAAGPLAEAEARTAAAGPLTQWWHRWGEAEPRKALKEAEQEERTARAELESLRSAASASPDVVVLRGRMASLRAKASGEMAGLQAEVETLGKQIDGLEAVHELGQYSPEARAARSREEAEAAKKREDAEKARKEEVAKEAARNKILQPQQGAGQQVAKFMPTPPMPGMR